MACFLAPVAEAVVVSIVKSKVEKKEKKNNEDKVKNDYHISLSNKLGWLNKLLWGGSYLLAIEHIWHGEVVPFPPFLTAMNNPDGIATMLHEIATVGVTMAITITLIWSIICLAVNHKENFYKENTKTRVRG